MRPADRRINGQTGGPEDSLCSLYLRIFTQRRTQKFLFSISFSHISFADFLSAAFSLKPKKSLRNRQLTDDRLRNLDNKKQTKTSPPVLPVSRLLVPVVFMSTPISAAKTDRSQHLNTDSTGFLLNLLASCWPAVRTSLPQGKKTTWLLNKTNQTINECAYTDTCK